MCIYIYICTLMCIATCICIYIYIYSLLPKDEAAKVLALVSGQWLALAIWLPTCFAAGEA